MCERGDVQWAPVPMASAVGRTRGITHEEVFVGCRLVEHCRHRPCGRQPCDELKSELDAKLQSKGVTSYTLEVVEKGSAAGKQVVGTCEGGTKEIVYQRG